MTKMEQARETSANVSNIIASTNNFDGNLRGFIDDENEIPSITFNMLARH
jgi:hypothetical protein